MWQRTRRPCSQPSKAGPELQSSPRSAARPARWLGEKTTCSAPWPGFSQSWGPPRQRPPRSPPPRSLRRGPQWRGSLSRQVDPCLTSWLHRRAAWHRRGCWLHGTTTWLWRNDELWVGGSWRRVSSPLDVPGPSRGQLSSATCGRHVPQLFSSPWLSRPGSRLPPAFQRRRCLLRLRSSSSPLRAQLRSWLRRPRPSVRPSSTTWRFALRGPPC
mmetsp:Transcript_6855/g.12880  ORF Transcript_6855/g.12880 Transcript_6855/m.12880 type:complete len:214 (+) Transcript_6855:186-827(+)